MNHRISITLLLLALSFQPWVLYAQNENSRAGDEEALRLIAEYTSYSGWSNNRGWSSSSMSLDDDIYGVEVEEINGELRVVKILLNGANRPSTGQTYSGNNLTGTLPSQGLGNLKKVRYFNVKQNQLTGELPVDIANMQSLEILLLSGRNFDPWDGTTSRTDHHPGKVVDARNNFEGGLPKKWGKLKNLRLLEISKSSLNGTLPAEYGNLLKLEGLWLDGNYFEGQLPSSWGALNKLKNLTIGTTEKSTNNFTGQLPESWGGMTSMRFFRLSGVDLSGGIPKTFSNWKALRMFVMAFSGLSGEFPSFLLDGSSLREFHTLNLSHNNITGELPDLSKWRLPEGEEHPHTARVLNVANNNMSGPLRGFNSLGGIIIFELGGNNFTGEFPEVNMEWWWQVRRIAVAWNNFEGDIPSALPKGAQRLQFHGNNFRSADPQAFVNAEVSLSVSVQENRLTFKHIEPAIEPLKSQGVEYTFAPQRPFGNTERRTVGKGQSFTLDFSDHAHSGNRYQWLRNGSAISGATSNTLTINGAESSHEGEYKLEIRNPNVPELGTLTSQPIEIVVSADGGDGDSENDGGSDGEGDNDGSGNDDSGSDSGSDGDDGSDSASPSKLLELNFDKGSDQENSPAKLYDSSEFGNHGVIEGPEWIDNGKFGSALEFSGSGANRVVIPYNSDFDIRDEVTLSAWIYPKDNGQSSVSVIVSKDAPDGLQDFSLALHEDNRVRFRVTTGNGNFSDIYSVSAVPLNEWTHITGVYDGSEQTVYLNSEEDSRQNHSGIIQNSELDLSLGTDLSSPKNRKFTGKIDRVRMFNYAISVEQVKELAKPNSENESDGNSNDSGEGDGESGGDGDDSGSDDSSGDDSGEGDGESGGDDSGSDDSSGDDSGEGDDSGSDDDRGTSGGSDDGSRDVDGSSDDSGRGSGPVIYSPAGDDGVAPRRPTFEWEANGSSSYLIEVAENGNGEPVISAKTTENRYTPDEPLAGGREYRWRVKSLSDEGEGDWSEEQTFMTEEEPLEDGMETELAQNYPNPFNPSTQIRFTLAETQEVALRVYDMAGRQVATLVEGQVQSGTHVTTFDASGLASGIYFYRLVTESAVITNRMTFIK